MELDLGGIAKGYTSSAMMDCFRSNGVTSGMVSLGGNVQTIGTKPDGSLWKVAIQNPTAEEDADFLGILETKDCAVITSGGYERLKKTAYGIIISWILQLGNQRKVI